MLQKQCLNNISFLPWVIVMSLKQVSAHQAGSLAGAFSFTNQTLLLVASGVGFLLISRLTSFAWSLVTDTVHSIRSAFVSSIELNSRDESYEWIVEWINAQEWCKNCKNVSMTTTYEEHDEDGDNRPVILYTPEAGTYKITYKGYSIKMNRTRDEQKMSDTLARFGGVFETITFTMWGNHRRVLEELINECMDMYLKKEAGKTIIYTPTHGSWIRMGNARPARPLESVVLGDGLCQRILDDAKDFLASSSWYSTRGIPYRRGYLLHGPPGTGKTSLVNALAGSLGMSICSINLNNPDLSDDMLVALLNRTPGKKCLILIEDVDAVPAALNRISASPAPYSNDQSPLVPNSDENSIPNMGHIHVKTNSNITLSGLLNALDGVASQEGRLLFMTTNHPHLLDPALSRPGRIDVKIQLGYVSKTQAKALFANFYPGYDNLAEEFGKKIPENSTLTPAIIQSHFMNFKFDPRSAISTFESSILDTAYSSSSSPMASSSFSK